MPNISFIGTKIVKERTSITSQSSVTARVVSKISDLEQDAEVGARSTSCAGDSSSNYCTRESQIAGEVADMLLQQWSKHF